MSTPTSWLGSATSIGDWTLVPGESAISFTARSLWGLLPVRGTFAGLRGRGRIGGDARTSGHLHIDSASVDTRITLRDNHLRASDFFDVERFPTIEVVVTDAVPRGRAAYLKSAITARGVTRALPLAADVIPSSTDAVTVSATVRLDRSRWGIDGNLFGMIGRTVTVKADLRFEKSGEGSPPSDTG